MIYIRFLVLAFSTHVTDSITFLATWGVGSRSARQTNAPPDTKIIKAYRTGDTFGASSMICSVDNGKIHYDVAVVFNTREDSSGALINADRHLYQPLIDYLNENYPY